MFGDRIEARNKYGVAALKRYPVCLFHRRGPYLSESSHSFTPLVV